MVFCRDTRSPWARNWIMIPKSLRNWKRLAWICSRVTLKCELAILCEFRNRRCFAVADCAAVLVAGGLGERLGYSGIKVALPTELSTWTTYLGLYCQEILALQKASNARAGTNRKVPLVIMTSDDTHKRTVELLERNGNFGMAEGQVRVSPFALPVPVPFLSVPPGDYFEARKGSSAVGQ